MQKLKPIHGKQGKGNGMMTFLAVLLGVIALSGAWIAFGPKEAVIPTDPTTGQPIISVAGCPDTGRTSTTLKILNKLNQTGAEQVNVTVIYESEDDVKTISTTDGVTTQNLICGATYTAKAVSTDGAAGDSSEFLEVLKGDADVEDGNLVFTATGSDMAMTVNFNQRGVPEVRAKDLKNDIFLYDDQDSDNKDYETADGIQFTGDQDNDNGTVVGTAEQLHVKTWIRANVEDQDFNDRGIWILVDAAVDKWAIPVVKVDETSQADQQGNWDPDERISYNAYEYAYWIAPERVVSKSNEIAFDMSIFALGGINPAGSDNISVDYSPRGSFQSTKNSDDVKVSSVKDDSSKTRVYTLHDTEFGIL